MKKHIDFIRDMINEVDSSIKFYEIIPPVDISKLMENHTICCIVKRDDENELNGTNVITKYKYTINIISKDITKDILSDNINLGIIQKCLKYLVNSIPLEWNGLLRVGRSGIDTQYIQYGFYILFLEINFDDQNEIN